MCSTAHVNDGWPYRRCSEFLARVNPNRTDSTIVTSFRTRHAHFPVHPDPRTHVANAIPAALQTDTEPQLRGVSAAHPKRLDRLRARGGGQACHASCW